MENRNRTMRNETELGAMLSEPSPELKETMKRLDGDIMILGIAGKMGVTMGMLAVNAVRASGTAKQVYGVSRFSNAASREQLEKHGIRTIPCDLSERVQVEKLPQVRNVIFMAGRKFGTEGSEPLTWAMNTLVPAYTAEHFRESRMTVFSTGCVYPLRSVRQGGCSEDVPPAPVGEYSQSCLGRERIFQYAAQKYGTKVLLFRLNYSIGLSYGVLSDIGRAVWEDREVDNSVGYFNAIWQGDANSNALRSLELASNPPEILNITGPETASVEQTALQFGALMGKKVRFKGMSGDLGYLNNSAKMCRIFGYPHVSLDSMIRMQADWIMNGGTNLNKPTHFEVSTGRF